jgi:hypothetical protein
MIQLAAFALGFFFGWQKAARRGGDRRDQWQYGTAHGLAFLLVSVALTVLAARLGIG